MADSLMLANNHEGAREVYDRLKLNLNPDSYGYNFVNYRSGYSYLREKENFLGLACFTETELDFMPQTLKDSALYFLNKLEIDILTLKTIKPEYDVELIRRKADRYSDYLQGIGKRRLSYLRGQVYFQRLEYKEAIKEFERLIYQPISDQWLKENVYNQLARSYFFISEYQRSIEYRSMHLSIDPVFYKKGILLDGAGICYFRLSDYNTALQFFERAYNIYISDNNFENAIYSLCLIGNCKLVLGDTIAAEEMNNMAEYFLVRHSISTEHLIYFYLTRIYFHKNLRQYGECDKYFNKAFEVLRQKEVSDFNITSLYKQACLFYHKTGNYQKTIKLADELTNHYESNKEKYYRLGMLKEYNTTLTRKGIALWNIWAADSLNTKLLLEVKDIFKEVLKISQKIYSHQTDESSKLSMLRSMRWDYDNLFITATTINYFNPDKNIADELYSYQQNVKANLFNAYMQELKASMYEGLSEQLLIEKSEQKKHVERLSYHINNIVSDDSDNTELKELYLELTKARVRLDSIEGALEANYPEYKAIKGGAAKYKVTDIQDVLNEEQLVVDYFIAENRLFIMAISSGSSFYIESVVEGNLLDDIRRYREIIEGYDPGGDYQEQYDSFTRLSHKLYNTIIAPIDSLKEGKHLIIIPDREMNLIPFETLIENYDSILLSGGYKELPYLVKSNPVTTLYTVNQLFEKNSRLTNRSRFIGFAPDYSIVTDSLITKLPGAKDEVNFLDYYFKGTGYYGIEASKQKFLDESYKYDIVHLAMHTKINDYNPRHSQLLLTDKQTGKDSLTIFEVYGMKFKTKLMVLSGCNTGSGELKSGEGVMSLARSYFYAGVDNIILTQWAVADKSSSKLMRHFYKHLKDGHATDKSLQMAKLNYLQQEDPVKLHPYYWSGYISVGKPVGNSIKQRNIKLYLILALLLSFSISYFFYKKNKR